MNITAIKCPECNDVIYSRARHDFRECSCGNCHVDGGLDYFKCGWLKGEMPQPFQIEVDATPYELYVDWSTGEDVYGKTK